MLLAGERYASLLCIGEIKEEKPKAETMKRKTQQSGMTLVEVLVFMFLALAVLGGSFPLLSRLMLSDKANEERLAAFLQAQSGIELLRGKDYADLLDGFAVERVTPGWTSYQLQQNPRPIKISGNVPATCGIRLIKHQSADYGEYCQTQFEIKWTTRLSSSVWKDNKLIVDGLIYQRLDAAD